MVVEQASGASKMKPNPQTAGKYNLSLACIRYHRMAENADEDTYGKLLDDLMLALTREKIRTGRKSKNLKFSLYKPGGRR